MHYLRFDKKESGLRPALYNKDMRRIFRHGACQLA